ncbi:hypothetical protein VdG1_00208 [Verticillium dahliae VDG1]|nr:hypothetical protein VdG1_00208 [Verticillium dahliae VDG1]
MSSHLSDEISSKLQGTAKVALDSLSFDPLDQPDRDNVERLVKMFRIEGFNRLNPLHFVSGTVSADVLQTSLAYSNLTADDLRAPTPPTLRLPPGALIECLHGKHRVTALRESKCFYPWWPVRLYEIVHYLQLIYDTFVFIMGPEDALKFVDDEGVQELELRAPGMSIRDDLHTADAIRKTRILRGLDDEPAREQVIRRLAKVEYLIPTVHTLQRDFYYLKQCTGVMKRLIAGKRRLPVTVQSLAWNAYTPNTASPFDTESEFLGRLKRLYLHIMQDVAGYFLVSEFLPITLQHFCKAPIYPTEPQLSSILHQVLTGIDFLLGSGLVHEQVSAANLLVSYDGKIKICDVERYSSGGNVSKLLESFTRLMMKLMDKEKLEDAVAGLTRPDRWSHEAIYMFTEAVSKPPVKQLLEHPFLRKREQGVFEWLVYFVLQSAPSS